MISGGGGDVGMASGEVVGMGGLSLETESRLWRIFLSEGMLMVGVGVMRRRCKAMRCDAMDVDKGGDSKEEGDK